MKFEFFFRLERKLEIFERERQERQEKLQKQQERKKREHDEYLRKQKVNNIYMNQWFVIDILFRWIKTMALVLYNFLGDNIYWRFTKDINLNYANQRGEKKSSIITVINKSRGVQQMNWLKTVVIGIE